MTRDKKSMPDKPTEGLAGGDRICAAMNVPEEKLKGLYLLNQILLNAALRTCEPKAKLPASIADGVAAIGKKLDQDVHHDPEAIAKCTADLFSRIACLARNSHAMEAVGHVNDSLYHFRTIECQRMKDAAGELMVICELLLGEHFDEVQKAITRYHQDRLASLACLLDDARQ